MKRPLAAAAAAFAAGIFVADAFTTSDGIFAIFCVTAFTVFAAARWVRRFQPLGLVLIFFFAGAVFHTLRVSGPTDDALYRDVLDHPKTLYTLEGEVRDAPIISEGSDYARIILAVDTVERRGERQAVRGGVAMRWSNPAFPLHPGERIRVRGYMESRLGTANFGIESVQDYFHRHDVHTQLQVRSDQIDRLDANRWSPRYWAARLRAWEAEALTRAVPEGAQPFVFAVWLGERSGLYGDQYTHFINTGTAHILAVSGVHCALVYATVLFLLGTFLRRPKLVAILAVFAVFAFALAAGARISSLRAATMLAIYLSARLVNREPDGPTALGIAGLLFLIYNPQWLFDAGFLLSFGSVASMLLFVPPILKRMHGLPGALGAGTATALGVQIIPLPLAAHYFHIIPLFSPLINIVIVPLLTLVLWLCLLTVLCAALLPPAAPLFGHALLPLVLGIEASVRVVSESGIGRILVPSPTWAAITLYGVAVVVLLHTLRQNDWRRPWLYASMGLFFATFTLWGVHFPAPGVDFLDVGHGDAAVVRTPGGTTMLIDGGDASGYTDFGERVVAPYLLAHGITRLDYLVVTHPDRDHLGGALHVLDTMPVGNVVIGPRNHGRELETILLARCEAQGVPVLRVAAGDELRAAGATLSVLHPKRDTLGNVDANDDSLVLRVNWEGLSVLFSGDVEAGAEEELSMVDCHAAVLKVPHHGSATSSSAAFLDQVAPRAAVISTGPKSGRRPVGKGVLERYEARGIQTLRTDHHGGVRLRVENGAMVLRTAR